MNLEPIKELLEKINKFGVPVPMLRDPKTGNPSVSLTMMFISFNFALVGLIGKWSKHLEGVNIEQAIYLFIVCASLYFGRTLTYNNKTIENKESEK